MLFLHHRNIFSGVSIDCFRDCKLVFATKRLTVPHMLSQELFPCDEAKKFHSAASWKSDTWYGSKYYQNFCSSYIVRRHHRWNICIFVMWTNYLSIDLKLFQGKHAQHLNYVSRDLMLHKKIPLLECPLLWTTKRFSVAWLFSVPMIPLNCILEVPAKSGSINALSSGKASFNFQNKLPDCSLWNGVDIITVPVNKLHLQNLPLMC